MDDANWISSSKENADAILAVADEFYIMTRSAINRNKTKILTNCPFINLSDPVRLTFGNSVIDIIPEPGPMRFLGVWIHPSLQKMRTFAKHQLSEIVSHFKTQI